jgi:hypothetical protein
VPKWATAADVPSASESSQFKKKTALADAVGER